MGTFSKAAATLTLFSVALIITACGGGGSSTGTNVPTAGVSISTSNAKPIGASVIDSVDTVEGTTSGTDFLTGVSVQTSTDDFNYADFVVDQLNKILSQNILIGDTLSGIIVSETYPCSNTNSQVRITGNIANQNTLTAGDTLTVTFSNCSEGGVAINGSMSMTFTQVSSGFDGYAPFALGINVTMNNFSVNDGGFVVSTNGDISMSFDVDNAGNEAIQLTGTSLSASAGGESELLTNYAYDMQYETTGNFSVTMQGTLASTKIDGSVSYTTITPFTGDYYGATEYPTAGELHITTSADNTQAWLIAQSDGTNVQIEIDTDGDDIADQTVMTTWSELQNL